MNLFRVILVGLLAFWAVKLVGNLLGGGKPKNEVRGKSRSKPIDLSNEDIEDVDFKEKKD